MLFFHHLFTGMIAGLFFRDFLKQKYALLICGLGAVFPDFIYKPVSWLHLHSPVGVLPLALLVVLAACLLLALFTGRGKLIGGAVFLFLLGVYLHLAGDRAVGELQPVFNILELHPEITFHSVIQQLIEAVRYNFFLVAILYEITSLSEWLFLFICLLLVLLYHGDSLHINYRRFSPRARRLLHLLLIALCLVIGGYASAILVFSLPNYLLSYGTPGLILIMAATAFAGAAVIAWKPFDRGYHNM